MFRKKRVIEEFIFLTPEERAQYIRPVCISWGYTGTNKTYGIQLHWTSTDDRNTTALCSNICMQCSHSKERQGIWQLSKTNISVNNAPIENAFEMLAREIAKGYYPIAFTASFQGSISSVLNVEKMQQRFAAAKPKLLRDFEGDTAIETLQQIEVALKDTESIKRMLTNDMWLSLFLAPLFGDYDGKTRTKEVILDLFIFQFGNLKFNCIIKVEEDDETRQSHKQVTLTGQLDTNDDVAASGTIIINYELDKEDFTICNITGHIQIGDDYHLWIKSYVLHEEERAPQPMVANRLENEKKWYQFFSK